MAKICRVCHRSKDESEFSKKHDNRDGLSTVCRECKSSVDAKYFREIHPEDDPRAVLVYPEFCQVCGAPVDHVALCEDCKVQRESWSEDDLPFYRRENYINSACDKCQSLLTCRKRVLNGIYALCEIPSQLDKVPLEAKA